MKVGSFEVYLHQMITTNMRNIALLPVLTWNACGFRLRNLSSSLAKEDTISCLFNKSNEMKPSWLNTEKKHSSQYLISVHAVLLLLVLSSFSCLLGFDWYLTVLWNWTLMVYVEHTLYDAQVRAWASNRCLLLKHGCTQTWHTASPHCKKNIRVQRCRFVFFILVKNKP